MSSCTKEDGSLLGAISLDGRLWCVCGKAHLVGSLRMTLLNEGGPSWRSFTAPRSSSLSPSPLLISICCRHVFYGTASQHLSDEPHQQFNDDMKIFSYAHKCGKKGVDTK
ncbi:hypothetical protein ILYODFUR_006547 [Ilyodon furcidens]|uniref:Uncharacterized protein n=1 Tax=Ilyodon furcidens TaxID=33524 RepID=A0ABV0SWH8_9TELE